MLAVKFQFYLVKYNKEIIKQGSYFDHVSSYIVIVHTNCFIGQKCCQLLLHIVSSQSASKDHLSAAVMSNNAVSSPPGRQRQLQLIECNEYNVLSYVVGLLITCLQVRHKITIQEMILRIVL